MNYKQTDVTGSSWVRCNSITIANPLEITEQTNRNITANAIKQAIFQEEKVIVLSDNKTIVNLCGSVSIPFIAENIITVLDPSTGISTGETVTHAKLYQILYSLYMQTAQERDIAQGLT